MGKKRRDRGSGRFLREAFDEVDEIIGRKKREAGVAKFMEVANCGLVVNVAPEAWAKMFAAARAARTKDGKGYVECGGIGKAIYENEEFRILDVWLMKQEVSGGSYKVEADVAAEFYAAAMQRGEDPGAYNCFWHSHAELGAFQSPIDTGNVMERFSRKEFCVSITVNTKGETYADVWIFKPLPVRFMAARVNLEFPKIGVEEAFVKELQENLSHVAEQGRVGDIVDWYGDDKDDPFIFAGRGSWRRQSSVEKETGQKQKLGWTHPVNRKPILAMTRAEISTEMEKYYTGKTTTCLGEYAGSFLIRKGPGANGVEVVQTYRDEKSDILTTIYVGELKCLARILREFREDEATEINFGKDENPYNSGRFLPLG